MPRTPSDAATPWIAVAVAAMVIGSVVVMTLHGCMNEHYRPGGHADVTFGISPRGDALVFSAFGEGGSDLYLLDLNKLRVTRIAATPDYEVDPEFSPDGNTVAYASGKPGDRADHLFVRSLDGRSVKQLTFDDANDSAPTFSPDGSLIAFTRDKTYNWGGLAANWDYGGILCVIKPDGSGLREITPASSSAADPRFSPDGRTILFSGVEGPCVVAGDGSQPPRYVPIPKGDLTADSPVYGPDGRSIAFAMGHYAPSFRIYVSRSDGTGLRQLRYPDQKEGAPETPGGGCFRPCFMADGKRILFFLEAWPDGPTGHAKENLWELSVDHGDLRRIADYSLFDNPLSWKPH